MEHDSPKLLFRLACEFLISGRVARPGVVYLLEHVATSRARAREETWARVEHLLFERRRAELDLPLVSDAYLGRTPLAWLGVGPAAVKAELGSWRTCAGSTRTRWTCRTCPLNGAGSSPGSGAG